MNAIEAAVAAARRLGQAAGELRFAPPVTHVYNPLDYAWPAHEQYLRKFATPPKRVLFLGMNPGPFGMVQTGIPFGQVAAVRDWLGICATIGKPAREHPKRPVLGLSCKRSEISGERLWGLFGKRFTNADKFFRNHFVANYCPLAFLECSGRNRTPDKLLPAERNALFAVCDEHLRELARILQPQWLIGIGDFATKRASRVLSTDHMRIGCILHPSPACPLSNKDWAATATRQLQQLGVWP